MRRNPLNTVIFLALGILLALLQSCLRLPEEQTLADRTGMITAELIFQSRDDDPDYSFSAARTLPSQP